MSLLPFELNHLLAAFRSVGPMQRLLDFLADEVSKLKNQSVKNIMEYQPLNSLLDSHFGTACRSSSSTMQHKV